MRIGVYVDGFNLYYGGRSRFGKGTAGWKWLDLRALAAVLVANNSSWQGTAIHRVVFCTAKIDGATNYSGRSDQDRYLKALQVFGSIDHLELGYYVTRVKRGALAKPKGRHSFDYTDLQGRVLPLAAPPHLVSVAQREEKGSDVNVAAHLLHDALTGVIDAAIVISNDSDLAFALSTARKFVPVGTVNPSPSFLAGALRGHPSDGVGNHWWASITPDDFQNSQLPDPVPDSPRQWPKPQGW